MDILSFFRKNEFKGKHFKFTGKTRVIKDNILLHQIVCTKRISYDIIPGKIGGWIEHPYNINSNYAWVDDEACVYEGAILLGNSRVSGFSEVYGNAVITNASIFYNAKVHGNATVEDASVFGKSEVYDNAIVLEKAKIFDHAKVFEKAVVYGEAFVGGSMKIFGDVHINGETRFLGTSNINSNDDYCYFRLPFDRNITVFKEDKNVFLSSTEFSEEQTVFTLKEFEKRIANTDYWPKYMYLLKFLKSNFKK